MPEASTRDKLINAVLMSLTAVPAYLLADGSSAPGLRSVGGAHVLVPSMLYTGTLMTENAFYPLFVLVVLMLVLTLERPTWRRQVALLVICALCFATRAQAVAFLPPRSSRLFCTG